MHHAEICDWVAQVPAFRPAKATNSKRKRQSIETPPSNDCGSPGKRRQCLALDGSYADVDVSIDIDATSRRTSRVYRTTKSKCQSSSKTSSPHASASQTSSPCKKLSSLALQKDGIAIRVLHHSTPGISKDLVELLRTFGSIQARTDILPVSLKVCFAMLVTGSGVKSYRP